ncbi:hypothetical protein [Phenylobacterium sp.]|jgi:hypothetical protein|uniref:hypothetical protein n=1 Tax=Phenylobacterium sp. TaxID=1871053 RepID=UPI002E2F6286|nr:hypothetical protein [Phenylobacterium sp.]HEX3363739.1 hypothetical protein [Phenylobacterium sp.]
MSDHISAAPRGAFVRALALGVTLVGLSASPLLAGPHGGGGAGAGGMSGVNGNFGGMSAGHMSAMGLAQTNGPNATDRDFGADRASDRTQASVKAKSTSNSNAPTSADRDHGRDRAADRAHLHGKP